MTSRRAIVAPFRVGPAQRLRRAIWQRIVWYTDQRRLLEQATVSDQWALIAVVGREWYREHTKLYNIRNRADLQKVLRFEIESNPRLLTFIGPLEGDGHAVTFFELLPGCDIESMKALCWIPESWLLARRLGDREVITVERRAVRYFQSGRGPSQLAGGIVGSAAVFALALGLPEGDSERVVSEDEVQSELVAAVAGLSWGDAWGFKAPTLPAQVSAMAKPIGVLAGLTLLAYLTIATAWLEGMHWWRSRQIEKYGTDVAALVEKQREIGVLSRQQARAAEVFTNRPYSLDLWQLVAEVWKRNGVLRSITFENGRVSLTGLAPVATEVLQGLSEHPLVKSAQFTAPVRESRGAQDFSIAVEFKEGLVRE